MSADKSHHASKRKRYTIVLVPDEDAGGSRSLRFAPWQVVLGVGGVVALVAVTAVLLVLYTPLALVVPFSSPQLENKYSKELVDLNVKVTRLMEELIDLRTYNAKLRRAFGESVTMTDSGVVRTPVQSRASVDRPSVSSAPRPSAEPVDRFLMRQMSGSRESDAAPQLVSFPAILPAEGYLTRGYLPGSDHMGIDIAGKVGMPVVSAADGHVVFAGWTYDYGYTIIIAHANGFSTAYKHNQAVLKQANSYVRRGDLIATLGSTGATSSGPHLHFEVWKDGVPVDPTQYVLNLNL